MEHERPDTSDDAAARRSFLRRSLTPAQIISSFLIVVFTGSLIYLHTSHPNLAGALINTLAIAFGVAWGGSWIVFRHLNRRRYREAKSSDFRRCTKCMHDLAGLAEEGVCPECGAPFTLVALEQAWKISANVPVRFDHEVFKPLGRVPRRPWLDTISLFIVFVLTGVVVVWLSRRVEAGTFSERDLLVVFLLPFGALPSLFVGKERDHLAYLARVRFRRCPRCHHSLSRRHAEGGCRRCRLFWDETFLEQTWRGVYTCQENSCREDGRRMPRDLHAEGVAASRRGSREQSDRDPR
jgi:hypothetical protein